MERDNFALDHGFEDFSPDFYEWPREELEKAVVRMGLNLGRLILKNAELEIPGPPKITTYSENPNDFFGYAMITHPSDENLKIRLAKHQLATFEEVESSDLTFSLSNLNARHKRREYFRELNREDLSALGNMLYYIDSPLLTEHQNPSLLLHYFDRHNLSPIPDFLPDQYEKNDNFLDPTVVQEVVRRLERDGEKISTGSLYELTIAHTVDGLTYLAEMSRLSGNSVDALAITCIYKQQILDSIAVAFDGSKQIIEEEPEQEILWNSHILSELFVSGQKTNGSTVNQYFND